MEVWWVEHLSISMFGAAFINWHISWSSSIYYWQSRFSWHPSFCLSHSHFHQSLCTADFVFSTRTMEINCSLRLFWGCRGCHHQLFTCLPEMVSCLRALNHIHLFQNRVSHGLRYSVNVYWMNGVSFNHPPHPPRPHLTFACLKSSCLLFPPVLSPWWKSLSSTICLKI